MQRKRSRLIQTTTQPKGRTAVYAENMPNRTTETRSKCCFVQTSHAMSYTEGVLTLERLGPTALMFSDRPDRVTRHSLPRASSSTAWDEGEGAASPRTRRMRSFSVFQPDAVARCGRHPDPTEQYDGTEMTYPGRDPGREDAGRWRGRALRGQSSAVRCRRCRSPACIDATAAPVAEPAASSRVTPTHRLFPA